VLLAALLYLPMMAGLQDACGPARNKPSVGALQHQGSTKVQHEQRPRELDRHVFELRPVLSQADGGHRVRDHGRSRPNGLGQPVNQWCAGERTYPTRLATENGEAARESGQAQESQTDDRSVALEGPPKRAAD